MAEREDNLRHPIPLAFLAAALVFMGIILINALPYVSDFAPVWAALNGSLHALLDTALAGILFYLIVTLYKGGFRKPLDHATGNLANSPSDLQSATIRVAEIESPVRECNLSAAAFLERVDLKTVVGIDIMAITGEITVRQICETLERATERRSIKLEARILLRADSSSDSRRVQRRGQTRAALERVRQSVNGLRYEIRHYSSVSPLRAVILRHVNGTYSAHLSHYDWQADDIMTGRESSTPWCYLRECVSADDKMLSLYRSWFLQFWGKHKIHTLIFDFDDTLFQTTDMQVCGWMKALEFTIGNGLIKIEELKAEVRSAVREPERFQAVMRTIFLDEQEEARIAQRVFLHPLNRERFEILRSVRLQVREAETVAHAAPISEITSHLRQLKEAYQLVIVSATSEHTIHDVLENHDLNFFSYIFGKEALHSWKDIEGKTPTFIRASNMLGIPLDRMAFIGDSDADFRAARQLGLKFIESRFNAERFHRDSLIRSRTTEDETFIIGPAAKGGLLAAIARVEASIKPA